MKRLFLILLLFVPVTLTGQEVSSFKLLNNRNDDIRVLIKENDWRPVRQGFAYQPVYHFKTTGKKLEILFSGHTIMMDVIPGASIFGWQILDYALRQVLYVKSDTPSNLKKHLSNQVGHNLRSDRAGAPKGNENNQMLFPLDGEVLLSDDIIFSWEVSAHKNEFILYEDTILFTPLYSGLVKDTMMPASGLKNIKMIPGKYYLWGFRQSDSLNIFSLASESEKSRLFASLSEIAAIRSSNPETYYRLKSVFEIENRLYSEAYKTLQSARKQIPSSPHIKNSFIIFLLRLQLHEQAKALLD